MTPSPPAADFDRLLKGRAKCREPGLEAKLATARPSMSSSLELTARHAVKEGELIPAEFVFSIQNGFEAALRIDGWAVPLIARLDGKRSLADIFEEARNQNELPKDFTVEAFSGLIRMMIERGFLTMPTEQL